MLDALAKGTNALPTPHVLRVLAVYGKRFGTLPKTTARACGTAGTSVPGTAEVQEGTELGRAERSRVGGLAAVRQYLARSLELSARADVAAAPPGLAQPEQPPQPATEELEGRREEEAKTLHENLVVVWTHF